MEFDLKKMKFSVIYSFDCPHDVSVRDFTPTPRKIWQQTEGDESYELSHLEGRWEKGKHRKMCAMLNFKQFEHFLLDTDLVADSTETMGSIGAPGCGFGVAPAISFINSDCDNCYANAYVTPIPGEEPPEGYNAEMADEAWDQVKELILKRYGRESFWARNGYMEPIGKTGVADG